MAQEKRSIKTDLEFKTLDYVDDFFSLNGELVTTTDMFTYTQYKAMQEVNDVSTNNFSNLVLTKKQKNSEWLRSNQKEIATVDIVTTLSFYSADPNDELEPGLWLYFDKTYEFWDVYVKTAPYLMTKGRPEGAIYNYFFCVDFIDDSHCRIFHNFGDLTFFMTINKKNRIEFTVASEAEDAVFSYLYDGEKMRLFKVIDGKTYALRVGQDKNGYYLFADKNTEMRLDSIIYTNLVDLNFDFYVNSSFVGYDRRNNISSINRATSAFELTSQNLLHHQYNTKHGVNFVPLKGTSTYIGDTQRGANLTISRLDYPDVDYRWYNTINSGINQEKGNDNIILDYYFADQVYRAGDGETVEFYIPTTEENYGKNPIWPYEKINIADTKFVKNGAFSSDVPYFADKVKKLQGKNTILRNWQGERMSPNNGTYLCTWLYRFDEQNAPVWLDRYYYPDVISREKALTSPHYQESFSNLMDKVYRKDWIVEKIKENTYFDKLSDLVIEPGNTYQFSHLSTDMVNEVMERMRDVLIEEAITNTNATITLTDKVVMDNRTWLKINHKDFKKANQVNFNFDLYLDSEKKMGIQLLGTDYKAGFTIANRRDISPFHYYATGHKLFMLNNNYEIKREFDLFSKYDDTINKFILGDIFDDVIVISNLYLYIFTYDLKIKSKISYSDILDINKVKTDDGTPLLGWPYAGREVSITYTAPADIDVSNIAVTSTFSLDVRFDTTTLIDYTPLPDPFYFESAIAGTLSRSNSLAFNNNIYLPVGNSVFKIIFTPDAPKDNFSWDERDNYPCKIRKLDVNEVHCNFIKQTNSVNSEKESGIENGFIEVENRIKNIYINENGEVYGFNYDQIALSSDGDTMYGIYGAEDYVKSGGWFWLYNQSLSKIKSSIQSSKFAEFGSPNSIDLVKLNKDGSMALVRNFHNPDNNTEPDNEKRLEIYDVTKKKIYNYDLSLYDEVYTLDSYAYIDEDNNEQIVYSLLLLQSGSIYKVEYQCNYNRVRVTRTDLPTDMNANFVETTNSNVLARHAHENKLYFNLFLPSDYLYDFCETIVFPLEDIQTGWYNFNAFVDLDEGVFKLMVNDRLYQEIKESETFVAHVNSDGTIFDTTYYVGCVGKKYGTTMSKILYNTNYDPYACKNTKIENLRIHCKKLAYYEYQAVRLAGKTIDTVSLTLPCGQRNNLDEIIRYFKYAAPGSIANDVKINISGTGLWTQGEFEQLEKEIREALEDELDCLVNVKEIKFI